MKTIQVLQQTFIRAIKQWHWKLLITLILTVLLTGCQSIQYYAQAVGGHTRILLKQRNIKSVLANPELDAQTKHRLNLVQAARRFAADELSLPDNDSYTRYVALDRNYVVWNVVATPKYEVEPIKACFWVVGCVSYKGFYRKQAAIDHAKNLKAQGLDVHVGGVGAYSTLGWFSDPVMSTMFSRSDAALVGLIFHELAHQVVFIKGDTQFNESFATAVAQIGLRQWASQQGEAEGINAYFKLKAKQAKITRLVLATRNLLSGAYLEHIGAGEETFASLKQTYFDSMKTAYAELKKQGHGTAGYDRFFASDLNHASLALYGDYHGWVGEFEALFGQSGRDWRVFYASVKTLSLKTKPQRIAALKALKRDG